MSSSKCPIQRAINRLPFGVTIAGASDEQIAFLKKRGAFAEAYAQKKGWNINDLSIEQVLEIRKQDGWKTPA